MYTASNPAVLCFNHLLAEITFLISYSISVSVPPHRNLQESPSLLKESHPYITELPYSIDKLNPLRKLAYSTQVPSYLGC